jgi:hypothetical protein
LKLGTIDENTSEVTIKSVIPEFILKSFHNTRNKFVGKIGLSAFQLILEMLMRVATKLVLISLVLSSALIASSEASKNETNRFVFTYELPGSSFFDDFPQLESVEEYIDDLADKWNATWSRIKNYTIAGLNFQVGDMAPFFAELIGELPFVKSLDQDVRMQVSRPLDSNVVQLSSEQTPYGINLVGALEVSDDPVSNRVVCIIDSGYDINHPDLPSTVTGSDFGAGPWDQDGQQHVS